MAGVPAGLTPQATADFVAARQVLSKAVDDDKAGRITLAVDGYTRGLELWLRVLKATPHDEALQRALRTKVEQYMARAEQLKQAIRERNGSAGGGGGGGSDAPGFFARLFGTSTPPASAPSRAPASHPVAARSKSSGSGLGAGGVRTAALAGTRGAAPPMVPPRAAVGGAGGGGGGGGGITRGTSAPAMGAGGAAPRSSRVVADGAHEEMIKSEVLDDSPGVSWDDVAGLEFAKATLQEAVILPTKRPDIFHGLRSPPKGVLLFGPPGTGKTMLAKAVATESDATFFNISASALTSKWMGEGEKLVRALFSLARKAQPSVIFIDEIDSMLSARAAGENDATRRLKTEFLVQLDGAATSADDRVVVMGATNRPMELDDAVLRRLTKRIYIPLPEDATRDALLRHLLKSVPCELSGADMRDVVRRTKGYSGSDLAALCREAAMVPVRELGAALATATAADVRPLSKADLLNAMRVIRPSVASTALREYEEWNKTFGSSA
mmetsp:Transcript_3247/g.11760  ORF Transcript_3247/g.11760 Transcript_3247/m.11760 type:complete len:497 (-) Transcript_3247:72-1562(-)